MHSPVGVLVSAVSPGFVSDTEHVVGLRLASVHAIFLLLFLTSSL